MRGIAVLLVFLFHLQVTGFGAGFLGVDVFFVLSGFLITSLLLSEADKTGRIALAAFWARRVRRLMPALILLLLVVAVVTHFTATFSERTSMRGDLLASTTYVANWHFISTSSYFMNTGMNSPLQHTWSLAIEEQFYLVWPLLLAGLVLMFRRPRATVGTLALIGVIASGIALAMLWSPEASDRAYMGTDSRIFEPLIGALGAALLASPRVRAPVRRLGSPLLIAGSLGLIAAIAVIRPESSIYYLGGAVAVSVATLMVVGPLWLGRGGRLGRGLEWRPLAWLGAVSYGVYLWHWPVMVWLGLPDSHGTERLLRGALVVGLTIGVAAVSYYCVERPIRVGLGRGPHPRISEAWHRRIALAAVPLAMLATACASIEATTIPPPNPETPVILITGDSVPMRLEAALERAATARGWRVVSAARGRCPVSGRATTYESGHSRTLSECLKVVGDQNALIRAMHPRVVVWWDRYSLSWFTAASGEYVASGSPRFWKLRRAGLEATVRRLTRGGAIVAFVGTEPPGEAILSRCGERCNVWVQFQIDHYKDITSRWNRMLRLFAERHPDLARFVSVTGVICRSDEALCDDRIDGVPARPDGTHYLGAGEERVVSALLDMLAPAVSARPGSHAVPPPILLKCC
jgi:peptidoglycan/LPS O-acetylase OafA/YrhL